MLLLLPLPAHAQDGLTVTAEGRFVYGPEDWKDRLADPQGPPLWNASLGLRWVGTITVERGSEAFTDWEFEASISDGVTTIPGLLRNVQRNSFELLVDVDGQRAAGGQDAIPALEPGTWSIQVRGFQVVAGEERTLGTGSTGLTAASMRAIADPSTVPDLIVQGNPRFVPVPESVLPEINEIGAGNAMLMSTQPVRPGSQVLLAVEAPGHTHIDLLVHVATSVLPTGNPLDGTPADLGPDAGVVWQAQRQNDIEVFDDGFAVVALNVDPARRDAMVVTLHNSTTGATASFLLPASASQGRIAAVDVQDGLATAVLQSPRDVPRVTPILVTRNPGVIASEELLRPPVIPGAEPLAAWPASTTRDIGISSYRIVAIWLDEDGSYASHHIIDRGVDVHFEFPTMGQGSRADVDALLSNPSSDGISGAAEAWSIAGFFSISGPDGPITSSDFEISEGSTITRSFDVVPPNAGRAPFNIRINTPEVSFTHHQEATVLERDAFEAEQKPWYDPGKYVPGPGAILMLALLGAALARRKR